MAILNSGAKSNISLGFWIGVGLLILGLVVALLQLIFGKIRG